MDYELQNMFDLSDLAFLAETTTDERQSVAHGDTLSAPDVAIRVIQPGDLEVRIDGTLEVPHVHLDLSVR